MKLKKIASLALAGIMAVSMLAGCKDGSSSSEPTNPVTPVTGAASVVNGELDKNADDISFADNAVLTNLLTNYYKENRIDSSVWNGNHSSLQNVGDTGLWDAVDGILGLNSSNRAIQSGVNTRKTSNGSTTYCNIYWINNDFVTREDALRMVGQEMDALTLPGDNEYVSVNYPATNKPATHDYSYTGSVAAIEAESEGGTESVWVIAVTVTQTATHK